MIPHLVFENKDLTLFSLYCFLYQKNVYFGNPKYNLLINNQVEQYQQHG